jgi:hypothetical protein
MSLWHVATPGHYNREVYGWAYAALLARAMAGGSGPKPHLTTSRERAAAIAERRA